MDHSKHWYSNINDPMKNVISDKYFVRNYYYIFHRIINVSIPMFALIHSLYIINNSIAEWWNQIIIQKIDILASQEPPWEC